MKVFLQLEPKTRLNLAFLFLSASGFWLSMTSLLPVLPVYIQDLGATDDEVGFVIGCFAIGLICSRTYLGKIADEKSRKIVLLIGAAVTGIAPWGYIFFNTMDSLPQMMAWRAFHGLSIAAFTTGYSALVVDIAPPKNRGEVLSYMSLAIPIGMSIGPVLGGSLLKNADYPLIFTVAAVCGIISFLFASQTREAPRTQSQPQAGDRPLTAPNNQETNRPLMELMMERSLYIPALVMLCVGLVFGSLINFFPLYIRELGLDFNVGLFYGAAAISSFLSRVVLGKASDRFGRGIFISGSLICYVLSMLCLAHAATKPVFIIAGALEGLGAGTLIPMMTALMSDRSSSHERGKVYSICLGGFDVGMAGAGFLLGIVTQKVGYQTSFLISAGLAMFALMIFLTQVNPKIQSSFKFAVGRGGDRYAQKL